jgi:hypothetical protein
MARAITGHASGRDTRSEQMTQPAGNRRTIELDADVYDLLDRTAATRETDINGALRYLLEVPDVPTGSISAEDE